MSLYWRDTQCAVGLSSNRTREDAKLFNNDIVTKQSQSRTSTCGIPFPSFPYTLSSRCTDVSPTSLFSETDVGSCPFGSAPP